MLFEAGHVIDGKYRLVRLIGTGGMGSVYEGENLLIRRRVAIKILHAASTGNVEAIRRFEREAQAAGEIGNDHILEVLDLGSLASGDRYMVMEYLDGETLAARIERHGRLTPGQIAPIARQFLTALASAHAAGIIHRDLKPENIFILRAKAGRVDFVKLIDFGISKFSRPFGEGEHRMTRADAVLGTPCYMSPEQARGARETDVRSDIYSCGVILYESVTGRLPFEGESFNDLMFKIALSDAPSPLTFVPSLDPDFAWLINHAIARDPEGRFASAQEFAEALDEWMRKNALTETLSLPRPSDAFPPRTEPLRSKTSATISDRQRDRSAGTPYRQRRVLGSLEGRDDRQPPAKEAGAENRRGLNRRPRGRGPRHCAHGASRPDSRGRSRRQRFRRVCGCRASEIGGLHRAVGGGRHRARACADDVCSALRRRVRACAGPRRKSGYDGAPCGAGGRQGQGQAQAKGRGIRQGIRPRVLTEARMQEKRSYNRYTLWFPVTIDSSSLQVWAVCNDVSAGGILISGSTQLNVGDVVTVSFRVSPDGPDRKLSGRIVRVEPRDDDPRAVWRHRMAIEFIEADATLQSIFAPASTRPPAGP